MVSSLLAAVALAQDPEAPANAAPLAPSFDELAAAHEALLRSAATTLAEREALDRLLGDLSIVMEDRRTDGDRADALARIAQTGDPRALPFLEAAADRATPALGPSVAEAALAIDDARSAETVRRVVRIDGLQREDGERLVSALGARTDLDAGVALWALAGDRALAPRLRAFTERTLEARHPEVLARLGPPPAVPDAIGGTLFVAAGATAGGVVLSSVGLLGQLDETGAVIGAVGGGVVGGGAAGLRLTNRSATAGEGLAFASGVGWGITWGAWSTTLARGGWSWLTFEQRDDAIRPAAGFRALGTLVGAGAGYAASLERPTVGDVVEVDVAGYLVSGATGGLVGMAFPTPEPTGTLPPSTPVTTGPFTGSPRTFEDRPSAVGPFEEQRRGSQRFAAAELAGSAIGLGVGAALSPRWELGWNDAVFGAVVGAEGAWLGAAVPDLVGVEDDDLEGTFLLPSHGGALLGLAVAEWLPSSPGRTLATAFGGGVGNALGAGIPLLQGYDDERSVSAGSVPGGLVGTVGGFLVEPVLDPSPGDAAMIGVATGIAGSTGLLVGRALSAQRAWVDGSQGTGLGLVTTGVAGFGTWALVPVVEARVDHGLFVGSAAAFGAMYGGLGTLAVGADEDTALFAAAGSEVGFTVLSAALVHPRIDFAPRRALVPEVGGVTGATLGALGAALFSRDERTVAAGTVVGATVGLASGILVEAVAHPMDRPTTVALPRGAFHARVSPSLRTTAAGTALLGLDVTRW